jgi:hypothetical protein
MEIRALECHSSGILRSRMPQLWHSTSKIAIFISVVAIWQNTVRLKCSGRFSAHRLQFGGPLSSQQLIRF